MRKRKKLRIAQVAPLWYPVPPEGYGGTENVVHQLTEGMLERGHDVTLYASGDSTTRAKLVSLTERSLTEMNVPWSVSGFNMLNLDRAFVDAKAGKFDIVHTHIDVFDPFFRAKAEVPSIATLHNHFWPFHYKSFPKYYDRVMVYQRFKKLPYIAISDAYRNQCPIKLNFRTIHHGVEMDHYRFNATPKDHFIWLGRISPVKGLHNAVRAVKRAKAKLLIAGPFITQDARAYYKKKIAPHVDGTQIRYVGKKDKFSKVNFLRQGKALLYPIEWEEPFGIIMAEAMACGTPVIAFKRGSVPEVVAHGKTGYVVRDIDGMVKAMKRIDTIDRKVCREHVAKQFSTERFLDKHERLYYQLIERHRRK